MESFLSLCYCLIFENSTDLSSSLESEGVLLGLLTQKCFSCIFFNPKVVHNFPAFILQKILIFCMVFSPSVCTKAEEEEQKEEQVTAM